MRVTKWNMKIIWKSKMMKWDQAVRVIETAPTGCWILFHPKRSSVPHFSWTSVSRDFWPSNSKRWLTNRNMTKFLSNQATKRIARIAENSDLRIRVPTKAVDRRLTGKRIRHLKETVIQSTARPRMREWVTRPRLKCFNKVLPKRNQAWGAVKLAETILLKQAGASQVEVINWTKMVMSRLNPPNIATTTIPCISGQINFQWSPGVSPAFTTRMPKTTLYFKCSSRVE